MSGICEFFSLDVRWIGKEVKYYVRSSSYVLYQFQTRLRATNRFSNEGQTTTGTRSEK